jgi:hypothetical protein
MFDPRFHVTDGIGQLHGFFGARLEQMKCDAFGRTHTDARQARQSLDQILKALGVIVHV